ncbi:MAG: MCE family protein [Solirubrobacterales bacterium]|nr:MCE family protein [Solirubrobacterales bacterium]
MTDRASPYANRILIGSVTVLVLLVAVLLAYNANSGLPFVPSYKVNVQVPDAAGLIPGDSVLIGGARVGYVSAITAEELPTGQPYAVLHLKLASSTKPLPVDSTDLVRPVSPLGEKYLQITRGGGRQTLASGATIPLSHTHLPVELDDLFKMFDAPTRRAVQTNLNAFGAGFAARGPDLNEAFYHLRPLIFNLLPVMSNLLDRRTRWAQLFPSLQQAANEVVGVADQQAQLFANLDLTFTPLSRATRALQESIALGPPALRTATRDLPAQAQFVNDSAELFHRLRPAFASLGQTSTQLVPAEAAGIPALQRAPQLNDRLVTTLGALEGFVQSPHTLPGLVLLTDTARLLEPTVAYLEPAQTRCNYLALFFRNFASALSESDVIGSMLDVNALPLPQLGFKLHNAEAGPSSGPANGPPASKIKHLPPIQQTLVDDSFLHSNPYPYTAAPGQPDVCMAGNERYIKGRIVIGRPPVIGNKTDRTKRVLP